MKSFNDLWIKSNSFCHLREYFYEPPSLRCPVMESWQLTPRCFGTHAPYYLSVGLLPTKSNPVVCSPIPLDAFCVSTRDVSTSHSASRYCIARSLRRSILVEFLSVIISWMKISKARMSRSTYATNQQPYEVQPGSWRLCWSCAPLSSYLTSWISGRDSCLVGVSCHSPRFMTINSCICTHASCLKFLKVELRLVETLGNHFGNNQH